MKIEKYTTDQLIDIMGAYLCPIKRVGGITPEAVVDDIEKSITSILKKNKYTGIYKKYIQE